MHPHHRTMLIINVVGGIAVLGSYALGIATHENPSAGLWGGVPESWRPLYTANMFLAAAGYLAFASFWFFRCDAETTRVFGRDLRLVNALFVGILLPSALWMPFTFAYLDAPSALLLWAVRGVLFVTAISSLAMIAALVTAPRRPGRVPAVIGSLFFSLQTAVLDATVWTLYFPS